MTRPTDTEKQARTLAILLDIGIENARKYIVKLRSRYGHGYNARWLILLAVKDVLRDASDTGDTGDTVTGTTFS